MTTLLLYATTLHGQTLATDNPDKQRVIVFMRQGESFEGYVYGVQGDTLIVDSDSLRYLHYEQVRKIILIQQQTKEPGFLYGLFAGVYLSYHLWLAPSSSTSAAYLSRGTRDAEAAIVNLILGTAVGGSLGVFSAPDKREDREQVFLFTPHDSNNVVTWKKFQDVLAASKPKKRLFHIAVRGANISMRTPELFTKSLNDAGYRIPSGVYTGLASNFNILRSLSLSWSVWGNIEIGFMALSLSEHNIDYQEYPLYIGSTANLDTIRTSNFSQSFTAIGQYITASYRYNIHPVVQVCGGLGIGYTSVEYQRTGQVRISTKQQQSPYNSFTIKHDINRSVVNTILPSAVLFGELSWHIRRGLTLGLYADYALVTPVTVPGMPDLSKPVTAQTVWLGNSSIGFTLGYHF